MVNKTQEAFEKWAIDYGLDYEPSFTRYDVEAAWQSAITYMQEKSEPVAWQFFKDGVWWYGNQDEYHKHKTYEAGLPIRNLYIIPQRQQPLKRLSNDDIEFVVNGWTTGDYLELANAIMDEMQEINK